MKKEEKELFRSFTYGADYEDIRYQVHSELAAKKKKKSIRPWMVAIPSVVVTIISVFAIVMITLPYGSSDKNASSAEEWNGDRVSDDGVADDKHDASGDEEPQPYDFFYPSEVAFTYGNYEKIDESNDVYGVVDKANKETSSDSIGKMLSAIIPESKKEDFTNKHSEVEYVTWTELEKTSESSELYFYSWTAYSDNEFILCTGGVRYIPYHRK